METELENELEIDRALCRAILHHALAMVLRPPCPEMLSSLISKDGRRALLDAAGIIDARAAEEPLAPLLAELIEAASAARLEDLEAAYRSTHGHAARGKVPPYEAEYGSEDLFRQSEDLADVNGFYMAFGLQVPASRRERADHIAVEIEFLSFLCSKEAYALLHRDRDEVEAVRSATRLFLGEHAGRFGPAFGKHLSAGADHEVYRLAGILCSRLIRAECRAAGVKAGPELLRLRSTTEIEVPMACGRACGSGAAGGGSCGGEE